MRLIRVLLMVASAFSAASSFAQTNQPMQLPRDEFALWTNGAPGALGATGNDIPTLTPCFARPGKATGAAMIVCPGGAYARLAPHEGVYYALRLNEQGITAFVLKYRLGTSGSFVGPGHVGILTVGDEEWLSCHFCDGKRGGRSTLSICKLGWTEDSWPK